MTAYIRFFMFVLVIAGICGPLQAQQRAAGIIAGNVLDNASQKPVVAATVVCRRLGDTLTEDNLQTDKNGGFEFSGLPMGIYRLTITASGFTPKTIDSIRLRPDRFDFNLNDILLYTRVAKGEDVMVYAEKPLVEQKDGKLIFNVGESALSSGATTSDLLKNTPLVTVDPNGNVLLKGKEVKILIDEKPVEINAKQLQELLESMPGSFIERIEVMTNPPPQYANERGGVINIVSKKGKVGGTLRGNSWYGTRGEWGAGLSGSYRKNKISLQAGISYAANTFRGDGGSERENRFADSVNYFNTVTGYLNKNYRPAVRINGEYDFNKRNHLNLTLQYNGNRSDNHSETEYTNVNRWQQPWRISERTVDAAQRNTGFNASSAYTWKDKRQTGILRLTGSLFSGDNHNDRDFFQQFFTGEKVATGVDSTQRQLTTVGNHNYSLRLNYDKPLDSGRYFVNLGLNFFSNNSDNNVFTEFMKKPEGYFVKNDLLSNEFGFRQRIAAYRAAFRYRVIKDFNITLGAQAEQTLTWFRQPAAATDYKNRYLSWLPFATIIRKWQKDLTFTFSYKKAIRRPGSNELNPAIDYGDPYNTRFGNPFLLPSYSHNFDWMLGKGGARLFWNVSAGYNLLDELFAQIRNLQPDGRTEITWQNISSRKEYEASAWGGYTYTKNSRMNLSVGYSYNVYSDFDKAVLKYRDGGSLTSSFNGNYNPTDLLQYSWAVTFNRFANPQGTVRNNVSMNFGLQRKFVQKRLTITLNVIDPFTEQRNQTVTYGSNFVVSSRSFTQTRNFRLGLNWNFIKPPKPKSKAQQVKARTVKPAVR